MARDKTYISNRQSRLITEQKVVSINSTAHGPEIELAVFEVKSRYVGYGHRHKVKTEHDARWRTIGNREWNYRSVHYSVRAALREILLLRDNAKGLNFSIREKTEA